jgi:hypothetical protein
MAQRLVEELSTILVMNSNEMAPQAICACTESSLPVLHCSRLIEPFPIHDIYSMGLMSEQLAGQ